MQAAVQVQTEPRAHLPQRPLALSRPTICAMEPHHIPKIKELLAKSPGVSLLPFETDEVLARAITMHPGASSVALTADGDVVGCCFALHDGLRASFRHVAVDPLFRGFGIGEKLLAPGYAYFKFAEITRIVIQVGDKNVSGQAFWERQGFRLGSGHGGRVVEMEKDID